MTRLEESRRGHEAKRIIEHELVRETLDGMKQAILAKWEHAPIADRESHHELKIMLKLLNDFEGNLKAIIRSGELADFEIESEKKRQAIKDRAKRFL